MKLISVKEGKELMLTKFLIIKDEIISNKVKIILFSLFILTSCIKSNEALEKKIDFQNTSENIPSWYLSEDEWDNIIVSVGTGVSSDLQMSYDKALLIAKKNLAGKIKSFIYSEIENIKQEDLLIVSKKDLETFKQSTYQYISQEISGYKITNKKIVPLSNKFRTYIRISYESEYARQLIIKKAEENKLIKKLD